MVRVLAGTRLKYTCRLNRVDGTAIEWQSQKVPALAWQDATRTTFWTAAPEYESSPVTEWKPGDVMICERNEDIK